MKIRLGVDKNEWDSWFLNKQNFEFLQSWGWGEFQKEAGFEVVRLQLIEDGEVVCQVQGFVHDLKFGKYLYIPRNWKLETCLPARQVGNWKLFLDFLKTKKFLFVRIEPIEKLPITNYQLLITNNRQPRHTLILDLTKSEDELLSQMHSKTRYNIRLAERKGVEIKQEKDIDVFWKLNEETTGRDDFKSHGKSYYEKMLKHNFCCQLTAYYNREPIASNIFIHFGKHFTYLHGASSNKHRNLMAPHLLQWKGIQMAKEFGSTEYDFWGIAPDTKNEKGKTCFHNFCWDVNHPWTGVTRFKAGFGGVRKDYEQAVDVVFSKIKYKLYQLVRRIR